MKLARMVITTGVVALLILLVSGATVARAASCRSCYPPGSSSCKASLTVTPNSVYPGGTVQLSGTGFAPTTAVTIDVCSIETLHVTTTSTGTFTLPVKIPVGASPSLCTITATTVNSCGKTLSFTTTFTILSPTHVTVPPTHTGEPWAGWPYWLLALAAAALGSALVLVGRRRRYNTTA